MMEFRTRSLTWFPGEGRLRCAPVAGLLVLFFASFSVAEDKPRIGTLRLRNGSAVTGDFAPSDTPGRVRWQGTGFTRPFDFSVEAASAVHYPGLKAQTTPVGEMGFEFAGGDLIYGRLIKLADDMLEIESPGSGQFKAHRKSLAGLFQLGTDSFLIYSGPRGSTDWSQTPLDGWRDEGGRLRSTTDSARIAADLKLPALAMIEFELEWKGTPEFVFSLGVDPGSKVDHRQHGFRFETWGDEVVAVRESATQADIVSVAKLTPAVQRLHLLAFLDQAKGTLRVFDTAGNELGGLSLVPGEMTSSTGVSLTNRHGDLSLDYLRITRWSGQLPGELAAGQARLQQVDGSTLQGDWIGFEPESRSFVLQVNGSEVRVPAGQVLMLDVPSDKEAGHRPVTVIQHDGTRLSGQLVRIENSTIVLADSNFADPVELARANVRSVSMNFRDSTSPPPDKSLRIGNLILGEQPLRGRLVPGMQSDNETCLVWQPLESQTASPLKSGVTGKIVYRETLPPVPASPTNRNTSQPQGNFLNAFLRNLSTSKATPPRSTPKGETLNLHLLTGDVIPCRQISVSEDGIKVVSSVIDATLIPHRLVKAAELIATAPAPKLKKAKKERLLTLPRTQKDSPPTHLLCAVNGDFLRCRLIDMNETRLKVEVQLEEVEIPRSRVAQLIWFHPHEFPAETQPGSAPQPDDEPQKAEAGTRVQVIRRDGNRMTFQADTVDDSVISGTSAIFKGSRFALADLDQILFGNAIEESAAQLTYQQWKLQPAVEPLVAQDNGDGGEGGGPTGTESLLVGKPAPNFELKKLDGGKFRLSDQRGKIIVLDFWATWCGPCMQTMPLVEEAMKEFDPSQVQLVAVNLEESAEDVKAVMERHNLSMLVALDTDGITARKYEANAIPQTVVVDRQGNIHRLFVGGGSQTVDALKATLKELTTSNAASVPDPQTAGESKGTEEPSGAKP